MAADEEDGAIERDLILGNKIKENDQSDGTLRRESVKNSKHESSKSGINFFSNEAIFDRKCFILVKNYQVKVITGDVFLAGTGKQQVM